MFDFIPVVDDRMVLALMKKAVVRDGWEVFLKAFTVDSWLMIIVTILLLFWE